MEVGFEVAKWNRDRIHRIIDQSVDREHIADLLGQRKVWHLLTIAECPGHQWVDVPGETYESIDLKKCTVCGATRSEYGSEIENVQAYLKKGCHNCKHRGTIGGDSVPYWGATTRLPEYDVCENDEVAELSDEEIERLMKNSSTCQHWEGIGL